MLLQKSLKVLKKDPEYKFSYFKYFSSLASRLSDDQLPNPSSNKMNGLSHKEKRCRLFCWLLRF